MLPALSRAKISARRVKCASNLHQLGVALRLYADDCQKYPSYQDTALRAGFWDFKLSNLAAGSQEVFLCPGNSSINRTVSSNWTPRGPFNRIYANASYGYNTYGQAEGPSSDGYTSRISLGLGWGIEYAPRLVAESIVVAPGDMIAIADCGPFIDDDGDGDVHPEALFLTLTGAYHNHAANVVFCDAHVEYAKTNRWLARGDTELRRWNNNHRPYRGG